MKRGERKEGKERMEEERNRTKESPFFHPSPFDGGNLMESIIRQGTRRLSFEGQRLVDFFRRLIWGEAEPSEDLLLAAGEARRIWGSNEQLKQYKARIPWQNTQILDRIKVSWADKGDEQFYAQSGLAHTDMYEQEIRIYRNAFKRLLGGRYLVEIVAHEYGHPLEIPSLELKHYNSLNVVLRQAVPGAPQKHQLIFNLFADIIINSDLIALRRRWGRTSWIEEVYRELAPKNRSKLWLLYMSIYERLWKVTILSRRKRRQARRNIQSDDIAILVDCMLRSTNPHADWDIWTQKIGPFARIIDKYIDEEAFRDVFLVGMRRSGNFSANKQARQFADAMNRARGFRHRYARAARRLSDIKPDRVQAALNQINGVMSGGGGANAEAVDAIIESATQAAGKNQSVTKHLGKLRRALSAGSRKQSENEMQSISRELKQLAQQYQQASQPLQTLKELSSQQDKHPESITQSLEKLLQQIERFGDEELARQAQEMRDRCFDNDFEAASELAGELQRQLDERRQKAGEASKGLQEMAESQAKQAADFEDLLRRLTHAANKISPGRVQRCEEKNRRLQESLDGIQQALDEANETANEGYAEEEREKLDDAQQELAECEEAFRQEIERELSEIQDRTQQTLRWEERQLLQQALRGLNNALQQALQNISKQTPPEELLRELEKLKEARRRLQWIPFRPWAANDLLRRTQELEEKRAENRHPQELLDKMGDVDVDYLDSVKELEELMRQAEQMARELELRRIGDVFSEISHYMEKEPETSEERRRWQEGKQEIYSALESQADRLDINDFRKMAGFAGVKDAVEANIWFYRARARHKINFPEPPDSAVVNVNAGVDRWRSSRDPVDKYDAVRTVQQHGVQIPDSTTLKARLEMIKTNERTGELEKVPDLEIWLDSSGSMPNPTSTISEHVLSTMVAAHCAINAGAKVKIINYSGQGNCHVVDFTDDIDDIDRAIIKYYGGGTVVPIEEIRKSHEENRNQKRYYIFTTDTYLHNLNPTIEAMKESFELDVPSYKRRCIGWTVFLQGKGDSPIKQIQDALGDKNGENVLEARPEIIDQRTLQVTHGIYLKRKNTKKSFCL